MFFFTALAYVLGLGALVLYSLANRPSLTHAIGPLYPLQAAFLLVAGLVALGMAGQALREVVVLPLRRDGARPLLRAVEGLGTAAGFSCRIFVLTAIFYGLLALICPFLPKEFAFWYDPIVVAGAVVWVFWWRALRDAEGRHPRAPS